MLREEAAALLKKWNYPFETLSNWSFRDDPWCDDVAVESHLVDALFLVYKIVEIGMCHYYGDVAVLFDHEHPTMLLESKSPLVLSPAIRPVVTPDGRYMYAPFNAGALIIDLMKRKYTGVKLDSYYDSICYDMQPARDAFVISHKKTGRSSVILPELLTWHEGTGGQTDIAACFQTYEQALYEPYRK